VSTDNGQRSGRDRREAGERASGKERRRGANRRTEARIKKRIRCEVLIGDKRLRGFVLDVSPRGLFVQASKPIDPGTEVGVAFKPPELGETIEVRARVARSLRVPPHLASVASPGVGLRISMAPPEYYDFLSALSSRAAMPSKIRVDGSTANPPPPEEPEVEETAPQPKPKPRKRKLPPRMPKPESETRYRVKAKHTGGPRSRTLLLSATSREHAESQALEQLGSEWKVIDVEGA
jgi:hypothetical protein